MKLKMAGNTNLGCVRKNNEDNFCVSSDLQTGRFAYATCPWGAEQVVDLGPKGVLLVVADGMGGTNAGEVASERAVTRVSQFFAPDRITADVTSRTDKIRMFMEQAIEACDKEVKTWGDTHPESKGMGTTMVMGWILDGKLYVAWCGDSRAYVFRPSENKIYQISKDHSYVQLLVDKEMLTREEMFDHPQGNIITRSLSHGQPAARPESLPEPYTLCDGDIVLLCSDGLSGMLHDQEMADIISHSSDDAEEIVTNLINGARAAGGSDNITAVLCKVESGGKGTPTTSAQFFAKTEAALNGPGVNGGQPKPMPIFRDEQPPVPQRPMPAIPIQAPAHKAKPSVAKKLIPVFIIVAVLVLCGAGWFAYQKYIDIRSEAVNEENSASLTEEGNVIDATDLPKDDNVPSKTDQNDQTNSEPLPGVVEVVMPNAEPSAADPAAANVSEEEEADPEKLLNALKVPFDITVGEAGTWKVNKCVLEGNELKVDIIIPDPSSLKDNAVSLAQMKYVRDELKKVIGFCYDRKYGIEVKHKFFDEDGNEIPQQKFK